MPMMSALRLPAIVSCAPMARQAEAAGDFPGVDVVGPMVPLGRAGTPEDIAEAVVFLCSPQSSWMTGEVLDLNGGAHLKRYPDINEHLTRLMNQ